MAEIKKKSTLERSARIVDRAADTGMRMKDIALKTKDAAQKNESQEERSPSTYASNRVSVAAQKAAREGTQQFNRRGYESVKTTQGNIQKTAEAVQQFKAKQAAKAAQNQQTQGSAQKTAQAAKYAQNQPVRHTTQSAAQTTAQTTTQHSTRQTTQAIAQNPMRQAAESGRKAATFGQLSKQSAVAMPQQLVNSRIRFSRGNGITSNRVVNRARSPFVQNAVRTVGRPTHTQATMTTAGRKLQTAETYMHATGQATFATQRAMQRTMAASGQTMQTARYTIRNASDFVRVMASAAASAFRITVGSARALFTALFAVAWLCVMVVVAIALFGGAIGLTGGNGGTSAAQSVSAEVEAYEPLIRQYAVRYGIAEYVDLIKAVMMQESGGRGGDPMQASEGAYNTRYAKSPNSITDPEYSIRCGVQELKHCLEKAGVENPVDLDHIRLALQGYNYGDAYITWAVNNYGGYSITNAKEYSNMQAQRLGWSSYGDPEYVTHVLRYYPYGHAITGAGDQAIVEIAKTQLGNVGGQPYWSWYGFNSHVQWCACFVSWCADQCGYIDAGIIPKHAACQSGADWFQSQGQWKPRDYIPSPGDIIYFDWNSDGHTEHVGIVERVENGTVYTIEGNASNRCTERHYMVGARDIYGYGIPAY
ncbi:MAG: lysozyme family protein [Eubacteriales bacterium]|nr:lysozyme family protein [Eubacteriales bacterium]